MVAKNISVRDFRRIRTSDIRDGYIALRASHHYGDLAGLQSSIQEYELLSPVIVSSHPGFKSYDLIAGKRRFRAVRAAKLPYVDAYVYEDISFEDAVLLALTENLHQHPMHPLDEAEAFQTMKMRCKLSEEEIAQKLHRPARFIYERLQFLRLPPEVLEAFDRDKISIGHAAALTQISDYEQQMRLLTKILNGGITVSVAQRMVRESRKTEQQSPVLNPVTAKRPTRCRSKASPVRNRSSTLVGKSRSGSSSMPRPDPVSERQQALVQRLSYRTEALLKKLERVNVSKLSAKTRQQLHAITSRAIRALEVFDARLG